MSNIPNELERKAVIDAVLNLFGASKTESLMLPIPGTNPQLWIAAGELEEIRALTAMTNDNKQPDAVEWKPTHAEVVAWNERNGGWFQGRLDEARCAIDDARSMHLLSAAPTPPSAPVQQSVREAFEQYVKDNWFIGDPTREYELSKALSSYDGEYIDSSTRSAWKQWQAALSTSPLLYKNEQAEGEEDPISRVHVVCDDSDGLIAYSSVVAGQLLFIRDCLEKRDVDGAMFALLHLSDPYLSKADGYEWSRMEEINKAPQPPQQEVIHSASKDAHDSNQLVEATLKLIAILEKGEWHGEGTMGELDGCDVCIAIHEAKTALAQSPSVGTGA
jgi:hypothetical protein